MIAFITRIWPLPCVSPLVLLHLRLREEASSAVWLRTAVHLHADVVPVTVVIVAASITERRPAVLTGVRPFSTVDALVLRKITALCRLVLA